MKLFKFVIFYTFIGIYETGLFVKSNFTKIKSITKLSLQQEKSSHTAPQRMKGALLKTAFRSIL
ncbi:MAG: hypothetical protein ACSHWW_09575 [Nonlabens sp.]|uniref:hypothetical protein n=1 Tax=Nonlabens sp. TaxID=1888209 RepID=UPI003EF2994F